MSVKILSVYDYCCYILCVLCTGTTHIHLRLSQASDPVCKN